MNYVEQDYTFLPSEPNIGAGGIRIATDWRYIYCNAYGSGCVPRPECPYRSYHDPKPTGMAAEEVEQLVTFPVETAVNGATGVRRVRSSSTNGFSVVWVEFDWETDVYLARQIVSEKLAVVSESLPSNVGKPTLGPQSSILGEMLIVGLTADSTSMLDLRTIADWTIRPRLLSTGGVAQVAVLGGDIKEYQIQLDPERMRHYGVTLTEVMNATREMNH